MNVVWIILVVVAVIVVIAVVAMMRRGRPAASETAARERGTPTEHARSDAASTKERPADVERLAPEPPREVRAPAREREAALAAEPEAPPEVSPSAGIRPAATREEVVEERPVPKPEPAEPAKPRLSDEELRARLQLQLADSERMLKELKEATSSEEPDAEPNPLAGSVKIIEEGLSEVRSLAERKEWGHAKDKGEALHAQLALMLQMARRGGIS